MFLEALDSRPSVLKKHQRWQKVRCVNNKQICQRKVASCFVETFAFSVALVFKVTSLCLPNNSAIERCKYNVVIGN